MHNRAIIEPSCVSLIPYEDDDVLGSINSDEYQTYVYCVRKLVGGFR
jgi:hypothetical protein